ncbi:MAG: Dabb family protein [Silvanigrellaceae bacterium]|nr:Dabb family protein [Silvanigrellaceae bacterium]
MDKNRPSPAHKNLLDPSNVTREVIKIAGISSEIFAKVSWVYSSHQKFENSMINHIVLLEFKKKLPESDINTALNQLGSLATIIPSIKDFSFGKNCSPEQLNKQFTHVFIMRFEDAMGRELYLNHSEHKRIAEEIIMPMMEKGLESVVVIDYEL